MRALTGASDAFKAQADVFDGVQARPKPTALTLTPAGLRLSLDRQARLLPWAQVGPRLTEGGRLHFDLPDGRWARLRDPAAAAWLRELGALQLPWLQRPAVRRGLLAGTAGAALLGWLVFGLGIGLDPLLDLAVKRLPPGAEAHLGGALEAVSQVQADHDPALGAALRRCAALLEPDAAERPRLLVVEDDVVNAFAVPGGLIVLHRGLLKRLKDQSELFALLGHEYCHLRERHALRGALRGAGLGVLSSLVLGDSSGVSAWFTRSGQQLADLRFSRSQETRADLAGLDLLQRLGLDPRGGTRLMRELEQAEGDHTPPAILSNHPQTRERSETLALAAAGRPPARVTAVLSAQDWALMSAGPAPAAAEGPKP
jgi:Zn-dependent protease with chaperone function